MMKAAVGETFLASMFADSKCASLVLIDVCSSVLSLLLFFFFLRHRGRDRFQSLVYAVCSVGSLLALIMNKADMTLQCLTVCRHSFQEGKLIHHRGSLQDCLWLSVWNIILRSVTEGPGDSSYTKIEVCHTPGFPSEYLMGAVCSWYVWVNVLICLTLSLCQYFCVKPVEG